MDTDVNGVSSLTPRSSLIGWDWKARAGDEWRLTRQSLQSQANRPEHGFPICYMRSCTREGERCPSRACRLPGHGFLSSVAPESDGLSLICVSHMKVPEHL